MPRQAVKPDGRPLASAVDNPLIYRRVTRQSCRDTVTNAEADARVQCRQALRRLAISIL
jgi:hypothetical protein